MYNKKIEQQKLECVMFSDELFNQTLYENFLQDLTKDYENRYKVKVVGYVIYDGIYSTNKLDKSKFKLLNRNVYPSNLKGPKVYLSYYKDIKTNILWLALRERHSTGAGTTLMRTPIYLLTQKTYEKHADDIHKKQDLTRVIQAVKGCKVTTKILEFYQYGDGDFKPYYD